MNPELATRLRTDKEFAKKISKLVKDYANVGFSPINYWTAEFDVAHDMLNAFKPSTKGDFDKLERGHPRDYVLPMTATQITTMTTYITQMLYGSETPHRVEGRGREDEVKAEFLNQLLKWNTEQQPTYTLGYLWIQDCLVFNRGIFYNHWAPVFRPDVVEEDFVDTDGALVAEVNEFGDPIIDDMGSIVTKKVTKVVNKKVAGYAAMSIVSPYDFCMDPSVPVVRMQEGRFCGHRFKIPWTELKRRAGLDPSDPAYVMPEAVEAMKKRRQKSSGLIPSINGNGGVGSGRPDTMMSRSAFERQRGSSPLSTDAANSEDVGVVEAFELWVRIAGKSYELNDSDEPIIWQVVLANDVVLSMSESTYLHGMFPYSVAEGRPNAHYQFAPSWTMLLYGLQKHVDYLKDRHSEALQRTVGNVFLIDPNAVDVKDFLNPDKEGLIMTLKAGAAGKNINEVFQQIPIKDLTENFTEEAQQFISYAEVVTGATMSMQGGQGEANSATEFAGTQQMAAGRLSNLARLLSVQGLVPQTKQFVAMFQQFMDFEQTVRYAPDPLTAPVSMEGMDRLIITSDVIQGEFDIIAHDGTLPGTDGKKVAAIVRLLESAAAFPQVFTPAPGNIDPKKLILAAAKSSGLDTGRFQYDEQSIAAAGPGIALLQGVQGSPMPVGQPQRPPGPAAASPAVPPVASPGLPNVGPVQPHPASV